MMIKAALNPGLRTKFGIGLNLGSTYYYNVSRTISDAEADNWTKTDRPDSHLPDLVMYCPSDRHLCAMYDDNGKIAGLQIAVEKENLTDIVFDFAVQGFINWTVDGKEYWCTHQYYVDEEYLALSKEERLASYDNENTLQTDGIWVSSFNGELMKISNDSSQLESQNFVKQACIPWMGYHYYYNLTEDFVCSSETLLPWFPLVYDGKLIGTIGALFGKLPIVDGERDWYERSPRLVVQATVPDAPECHMSLVDSPGMLSMHIWFIDNPWSIYCIFE